VKGGRGKNGRKEEAKHSGRLTGHTEPQSSLKTHWRFCLLIFFLGNSGLQCKGLPAAAAKSERAEESHFCR